MQEHPDKRSDALDTIRLLNSQKISADEVNTEKISRSFQHILADIRTGIREKRPVPPPATREVIDIMQKELAEKPRSQLTPDDIADAMMAFVDSKHSLQPNARSIIYRFFRWFMRYFGESRHNPLTKRFEAHQDIVESLDEVEKNKE